MEIRTIKLSEIKANSENPRYIKDEAYKKLVQSIKDFPEMRDVREIVVNKEMIILGGNMRFRAMQEAGIKETTVKIVDWDEKKQKEFIIKDNVESGDWEWDKLANEWDLSDLSTYGIDVEAKLQFNPNINPDFDTSDVSKEEIEKKAKELAEQMMKEQMTKELTCPECGHTFFIEYEK